jgi:hypothetical protein
MEGVSGFLTKILVTTNDQSLNDKIVIISVHSCPIFSRLNVTKVICNDLNQLKIRWWSSL